MGHIHIVGIGLDGKAGLPTVTQVLVEQAQLLVGSDRHLAYFPGHSAQRCVLGDLGQAIAQLQAFLSGEPENQESQSQEPESTAIVLTSGDPLFFGLGRLLLDQLPLGRLTFHPHLSSVQLAFSRLKLSWQDAAVLSIHGRDMEPLVKKLLGCHPKIAVLTDPVNSPAAIARLILSLSLPVQYQCTVCENLGGQQERITPGLTAETLQTQSFASLSIVLLTPVFQTQESAAKDLDADRLETLPLLGVDDRQFATFRDRPGLITKREIRALALAELSLQPRQVVWDIGAGTGSVSVEIARLCPESQVYAIERTAAGVALIQQNRLRFNTLNVYAAVGKAPGALTGLPMPDRVFIGGNGGQLQATLSLCARELAEDGRIVMAIATLETLAEAQAWFKQAGWQLRLLQVQLAKGGAIANLTRWTPMNPVTLLTAWRSG